MNKRNVPDETESSYVRDALVRIKTGLLAYERMVNFNALEKALDDATALVAQCREQFERTMEKKGEGHESS